MKRRPLSTACAAALMSSIVLCASAWAGESGRDASPSDVAKLSGPHIVTSPSSFYAAVLGETTTQQVLTIENTGDGTLEWQIPPPAPAGLAARVPGSKPQPKGQRDERTGPPTKARGGPDPGGTSYVDSDDPQGPAFTWTDVSATGTPIPIVGDDAMSDAIPLGFQFPFYGGTFDTVHVCTNGFLTFGESNPDFFNQPLPSEWAPANLIAPLWDDLRFVSSQNAVYVGTNDEFTVQFTDVPGASGDGARTFQVTLFRDGRIMFRYFKLDGTVDNATVGIQDGTRQIGLQVAFNHAYLHEGLAVLFYHQAYWISVDPASGSLAPGQRQDVSVVMDATGLDTGRYEASLDVESNDPDQPSLLHPVTMDVTASPNIGVEPKNLAFPELPVGGAAVLPLVVTNTGRAVLTVDSITSDSPAFDPQPAAVVLPVYGTATIQVTFRPIAAGSVSATLLVHSDDPDSPEIPVLVTGTGRDAPAIAVVPDALEAALLAGQDATETLTISNSGLGDLHFSVASAITSRIVSPARPVPGGTLPTAIVDGADAPDLHVGSGVPAGPGPGSLSAQEGSFEPLPDSPTLLTCVAADPAAGAIYAQGVVSNVFFRYDIGQRLWSTMAQAPIYAENNGGAALLGGRIYTSYAAGQSYLGVYDIATDSWTIATNPAGATANIASDGTRYLYFALGDRFLRYDPTSGGTENLASPPFLFEPWGGIAYFEGRVYGHQGNGQSGFAVYDVVHGTWRLLPPVPGRAVLGAAIDPVMREYHALGPYGGTFLYRFSLIHETWTASTLPFVADDAGLAFVPGQAPGVYIVQGERGIGFTRYAPGVRWLAASPATGTVAPGGSASVAVHFDAAGAAPGVHEGRLEVRSDDPANPLVVVPTTLHVTGVPQLSVLGPVTTVESSADYTTFGETTRHQLAADPRARQGSVEVVAEGNFGFSYATATVTAEGLALGAVGPTTMDCVPVAGTFGLDGGDLGHLAADGVVHVDVTNSLSVGIFCHVNRHTVRLRYRTPADRVDAGVVYIGQSRTLEVAIQNTGDETLHVASVSSDNTAFSATAETMTIAPNAAASFSVTFTPDRVATFDGLLTIASDDPVHPVTTLPVHGTGAIPPVITVQPAALQESLSTNEVRTATVTIGNTGGMDLTWSASVVPSTVDPPLESVLARLDALHPAVTARIPSRYTFGEGVREDSIYGNGMYTSASGNWLSAGPSAPRLAYSDGAIVADASLGAAGRYFTRLYPGLFVFAADLDSVSEFMVSGYLAASGLGAVNGTVLDVQIGDHAYIAFVKRVYGSYYASVNHVLLVPRSDGPVHEYAQWTGLDDHKVSNLGATRRLYYLLFAGSDGKLIEDADIAEIARSFIGTFATDWISVSPASGTVAPGATGAFQVRFDAGRLETPDLGALIAVVSNDPLTPRIDVPATVHVTAAPDMELLGSEYTQTSSQAFTQWGETTHHAFPIGVTPRGGAKVRVDFDGVLYYSGQYVNVRAESVNLGLMEPIGIYCGRTSSDYVIGPADFTVLASDGNVAVDVANSSSTGPSCQLHQHTVVLTYNATAERLDCGIVFVGAVASRKFTIRNNGLVDLHVSSIATDNPAFSTDLAGITLAPGQSVDVTVTFHATSAAIYDGVLTVSSDDPKRPTATIALHGQGVMPPVIDVAPVAFEEQLMTNGSVTRTLTIGNRGEASLVWTTGLANAEKFAEGVPLENLLAALDAHHADITRLIPNRFDFTDGVLGNSIEDGGQDMFDGGNFLQTNRDSRYIDYSDGVVKDATAFGATGRYFTRKVPGLFVLAADLDGVTTFAVTGNLGADGAGVADGTVLQSTIGGARYLGFVKRVSGTNDASVHHLVIVPYGDGITHSYATYTNDDTHSITGLTATRRIYYLLFSTNLGFRADDATMQSIMDAFLGLLGPEWLSVAPAAGSVPGNSSAAVLVTLSAASLGTVDKHAVIHVASNDPLTPVVDIPVTMHVTAAPDITLLGTPVDLSSSRDYNTSGAVTNHDLVADTAPGGPAQVDLIADGDFGNGTADLTAESLPIGSVGRTGFWCRTATGHFTISTENLAALVADGHVKMTVTNAYWVYPNCSVNRHTLRLRYHGDPGRIDFGDLYLGAARTVDFEIRNDGIDPLVVSGLTSDDPDFTATAGPATIAAGQSGLVTVRFSPTSLGQHDATLIVASNDPDEPAVAIAVHGAGITPPSIAIAPPGIEESALSNQVVVSTLTIGNLGGAALEWHAEVLEARKNPASEPSLEEVLDKLDGGYPKVTAFVPNRFDFTEGTQGYAIGDGGSNMYDYGNEITTSAAAYQYVPYSDGVIVNSSFFGSRGRYFTRKVPGLFVLAADLDALETFQVYGTLGAYGRGSADGTVLDTTVGTTRYLGFVKRVWNGGTPSVNHLVIIPYDATATHTYATTTYGDDHRVTGLSHVSRMYYLVYASRDGGYVDDRATLDVMRAFLGSARPPWIDVAPWSGTVGPGADAGMTVTVDTKGIGTGTLNAVIRVSSNDPSNPAVDVPVVVNVTGRPKMKLAGQNVTVASQKDYATDGAATHHDLVVGVAPAAGGVLELVADGDYGDYSEQAFVTAESIALGSAGATGADCSAARGQFDIDATRLAEWVADGHVLVDVQNSAAVNVFCSTNRHTVRLTYARSVERMDFSPIFVGLVDTAQFEIHNVGTDPLVVSSITSDHPAFSASPATATIAPGAMATITVSFAPVDAGEASGTLTIASNDPDAPATGIALHGTGLLPPVIGVSPTSVQETLDVGQSVDRSVTVTNTGGADLVVTAELRTALPKPTETSRPFAGLRSFELSPARNPGRGPHGPKAAAAPAIALPFVETFEDGNLDGWYVPMNGNVMEIVDGIAADGTSRSLHQHTYGGYYHYSGVEQALGNIQPQYASFWIRPGAQGTDTAYVVVRGPGGEEAIWFFAEHTGHLYVNDDTSVPYTPGTWCHVEFRDIDFKSQSFSYYVNDELIRTDIPFRYPTTSFATLDMYNYSSNSDAYWDEVVLGDAGGIPPRWVRVAPATLVVPPGASGEFLLHVNSSGLTGGDYSSTLSLAGNDPLTPLVTVPVGLHAVGHPDLVVAGIPVTVESTAYYGTSGGMTRHDLVLDAVPNGAAALELEVEGDYGDYSEYASLYLDDTLVGNVGGTGSDCTVGRGRFPVGAALFSEMAADGHVIAEVVNSYSVDVFCTKNRHTVRLNYHAQADTIDFGRLFIGASRTIDFELLNDGSDVLNISSVATDHPAFSVSPATLVLPPGKSATLSITFAATEVGTVDATLAIASNDPDTPTLTRPLHGLGLVPPALGVTPAQVDQVQLVGEVAQRTIAVRNTGGSDLVVSSAVQTSTRRTPTPPLPYVAPPPGPLAPDTTAGNAPPAQRRPAAGLPFLEDFEDGDLDGWSIIPNANLREVVTGIAADGTSRSLHQVTAVFMGHFNGLERTLDNVRPGYASFWIRPTRNDVSTSYFVLRDPYGQEILWFFARSSGRLYVNGEESYPYAADTWYHIEFRDIDFNAQSFSYWVDGTLVRSGIPFRNNATGFGVLDLYNWDGGTEAYWDEIVLSETEWHPARWLTIDTQSLVVPPGETRDIQMTLDATQLVAGTYDGLLQLTSNDPLRPVLDVPVHLEAAWLIAAAGPDRVAECGGGGAATVHLDGSGTRDVDGHQAVTDYAWSEAGTTLGHGETLDVTLAVGTHSLSLRATDATGHESTDEVVVTVRDTTPPAGGITGPPANACFGPAALPVVVHDDYTDACGGPGAISRTWDPPDGASTSAHGDHTVRLVASDGAGNAAPASSVTFTIDTVPPVVTILPNPPDWTFPTFIPFQQFFRDSDDDGAAGDVVHETIAVDGCTVYDGFDFGNRDGRLLDESLPATEDEMCRLVRLCHRRAWNSPTITVTARDCGGNATTRTMIKVGTYTASESRCPRE